MNQIKVTERNVDELYWNKSGTFLEESVDGESKPIEGFFNESSIKCGMMKGKKYLFEARKA